VVQFSAKAKVAQRFVMDTSLLCKWVSDVSFLIDYFKQGGSSKEGLR